MILSLFTSIVPFMALLLLELIKKGFLQMALSPIWGRSQTNSKELADNEKLSSDHHGHHVA
jgi:hypothetical protein